MLGLSARPPVVAARLRRNSRRESVSVRCFIKVVLCFSALLLNIFSVRSLCSLCLCGAVGNKQKATTTETQRTQRTRREVHVRTRPNTVSAYPNAVRQVNGLYLGTSTASPRRDDS